MLLRHVAQDAELGYCQGMTFVAAVFAVASKSQREAYQRFREFTRRVRTLWLPGLPLLRSATRQFEALVRARPDSMVWFKHLQAHGVETSMYLPQPLLSLFGAWLPLQTVLTCLELLEHGNLHGMVAVAVAVLDHIRGELLRRQCIDSIMRQLQGLKVDAPDPKVLLAGARAVLQSAGVPPPVPRAVSLDWAAGLAVKAPASRGVSIASVAGEMPAWLHGWPELHWSWRDWVLWSIFS